MTITLILAGVAGILGCALAFLLAGGEAATGPHKSVTNRVASGACFAIFACTCFYIAGTMAGAQ